LVASVAEPQACKDPSGNCDPSFDFAPARVDPIVAQSTGSFNATSLSLGMKVRPFANMLLTGNVLIRLNDGGLGVRTVPLIGVSYTF